MLIELPDGALGTSSDADPFAELARIPTSLTVPVLDGGELAAQLALAQRIAGDSAFDAMLGAHAGGVLELGEAQLAAQLQGLAPAVLAGAAALRPALAYRPELERALAREGDGASAAARTRLLRALAHVRRNAVLLAAPGRPGEQLLTLVPQLERLTPVCRGGVSVRLDAGSAQLVVEATAAGAQRGQALGRCFGEMDNDALLQQHGVVVGGNLRQTCTVGVAEAALPEGAALSAAAAVPEAALVATFVRCAAELGPAWPGAPDDACDLPTLMLARWTRREHSRRVRPLGATLSMAALLPTHSSLRQPLPELKEELLSWEWLAAAAEAALLSARVTPAADDEKALAELQATGKVAQAAVVALRLDNKRLLADAAARVRRCVSASRAAGALVLAAPPDAALAAEQREAAQRQLGAAAAVLEGLGPEFAAQAAEMPRVIQRLLLEPWQGETSDVAPAELYRALRLDKEAYRSAKLGEAAEAGAPASAGGAVLRRPRTLPPEGCARLRAAVDGERTRSRDTVDGCEVARMLVLLPVLPLVLLALLVLTLRLRFAGPSAQPQPAATRGVDRC